MKGDKKDTSMTATMLLQDSMLKPSVFRPASENQNQSFTSQNLLNGNVTDVLFDDEITYFKRTHKKKRQIKKAKEQPTP